MRLIELSANKPDFKAIRFNRTGLTVIRGSNRYSEEYEGSGNGVGKSLALGLVHHCLGANAQSVIKEKLSDWVFSLRFELNGIEHCVERSGDGNHLVLDGVKQKNLAEYKNWLDNSGVFNFAKNEALLSFRALIKRFTRYAKEDCLDPLKTNKEDEAPALLRTCFLLGLAYDTVQQKIDHKKRLDALNKAVKYWKEEPILHEVFQAGHEPQLRFQQLEREIPRLETDLKQFDVAENYHDLLAEANAKTDEIRRLEKEISTLQFQLEGIEKLLRQHPDISRNDLLGLYEGLQAIFKPDILVHFEKVEGFQKSFLANRMKRLETDKSQLSRAVIQKEDARKAIAQLRDDLLKNLQGKRALDEYVAISNQLASFKAEREKLHEYLTFNDKRQEQIQTVKEVMLHEDAVATTYVRENPHSEYNIFFQILAGKLYPKLNSGIVLDSNTGNNSVRYALKVQIEGDNSDGIGAAKVLCFDWIVLTQGKNHTVDFLWHDNRLFAHMGANPRAAWFKEVIDSNMDKQYIATINTENHESMKDFLDESHQQTLDNAVVLDLYDDDVKNKLLGIQF
ncbi:MAG: DUF2326 domain-containing protein [Sulfuricellaceae bacterium]